jgi:eukaryotic-like serine/threonine-protein kinase
MTPQQWQKLQALFEEVTEKPLIERHAALQRIEATVTDSVVREELRRLVEHADPDASFLRPLPGILSASVIHPGDAVADRFEILRLIGRGGMGEVFEALDRKLGERVAIKVIAGEFAIDPGSLERFQREVQIARRISHPNICRIHDLGEHSGIPYLSMELLEGDTLASRLEDGPLPLQEWERLATQLFDGLRAAHSVGIVHRDLKPSNLMIAGSRLVILDFGLARPVLTKQDSLTHTGMLIGTLDWMAPEQLFGEYDERSDLYSAALILVHALKGKRPENESGGLAGALRRATGDTDFRKMLPAHLPRPWRYVLLRCLERDPANRPAGAQEVHNLLTRKRSLFFGGLKTFSGNSFGRWAAATALLLALIVLGLRYLKRPGLQPGSLIMVASTIDATGEKRFDGITSVLRADLGQSSRFNVWDSQRLGEVLRSLRRDTVSEPGTKDWREIAFREKADLLVFSTVSRLGDGYTLAIRAEQLGRTPETSLNSWDSSWRTTSADGLFDAEHEAAQWIRKTAGENAVDLSAHNRSPRDITTSSWEALQAYDLARSLTAAQDPTEAIPEFRRAIQMDSQFAMARMWLGDLLNAQNNSEEGFAQWRRAAELARAQHLSDHEKLNIESRYALEISDFRTAEPSLREWVRKYPNDSLAPRLLASALLGQGRYPEAIRVATEAQQKFGPTVFGTSVLIRGFAGKNQLADMEAQIQILEKLSAPDLALQFRGMNAALRGDYESAAGIFRQLALKSSGTEASRAIRMLANLEADRGRLDEACGILRDAISKDREAGENGLASQKTVALAFLEGQLGHREMARARVQDAVSIAGPSPRVIVESVTILARNGYVDDASRLMKRFSSGEGPRFDGARYRMQGEIKAAAGELEKAAELLDRAASTERPRDPKEYLARVLNLAGYRQRANMIYQEIADDPWLIWASPEDEWPGTRFIARQHLTKIKGE